MYLLPFTLTENVILLSQFVFLNSKTSVLWTNAYLKSPVASHYPVCEMSSLDLIHSV